MGPGPRLRQTGQQMGGRAMSEQAAGWAQDFPLSAGITGCTVQQCRVAPALRTSPTGGCISGSRSVHTSQDSALLQLATAAATAVAVVAAAAAQAHSPSLQMASGHCPVVGTFLQVGVWEGFVKLAQEKAAVITAEQPQVALF